MNQSQTEFPISDGLETALAGVEATYPKCVEVELAPMVLIVEDDPDIAMSLQFRLCIQGYRSCLATNALDAVTVALEHEPVCAILDINVPQGDGFSVATELRSRLESADLPVVFLTASMRLDIRERAESFGHSAFVSKPYNAAQLMQTVEGLIDFADDV